MTPDAADRFDLVGRVLDERVLIERFVAEGGFARVYRGHHRTLDRPVAVKVLKVPAHFGEGARAMFCDRFAQEARLIARLDHPAVVRVLDSGVVALPEGEAPYMILDWLTGVPLADAIAARAREGRPYSPAETLRLLGPVMEALALAHDQAIAHRDVTPQNLMLVATPDGEALRLLDFGVAKVIERSAVDEPEAARTETAFLAFSPRYAAPEQASNGRTGPWTDVHGLGLVCASMLTGQRPYKAPSREAAWALIFAAERPTPARFGVDVGAWEPVLARALALTPAERHPDARHLLRALTEALPGAVAGGSFASEPSPPARGPSRAALYAVGSAAATLCLVALGFTLGARRARAPLPPVTTAVVAAHPAPAAPAPAPPAPVAPALPATPDVAAAPVVRRAPLRRPVAPRAPAVAATSSAPPSAPLTAPSSTATSSPSGPARPRIQPVREYQ